MGKVKKIQVSRAVFNTNDSVYGPNSEFALKDRNSLLNDLNFTAYNIGTNGLGFSEIKFSVPNDTNLEDIECLNKERNDFLESLRTESDPVLILWNIYSEEQVKLLPIDSRQCKEESSEITSVDTFLVDLEEDVREEAQKYGPVKKVVAPRLEEFQGSILIYFETEEDCLKCAKRMNGRSFDGNILQVELAGAFLQENIDAESNKDISKEYQKDDDADHSKGDETVKNRGTDYQHCNSLVDSIVYEKGSSSPSNEKGKVASEVNDSDEDSYDPEENF